MSPELAERLLNPEQIRTCALVLSAIDSLQEQEFNLMEPKLRKLGRFSESDIIRSAENALEAFTKIAIPGNGNGTKMTLSMFLRGLQLIGREKDVEIALSACAQFEKLQT
jgi:hypothetical protein